MRRGNRRAWMNKVLHGGVKTQVEGGSTSRDGVEHGFTKEAFCNRVATWISGGIS